MVAWKGPFIYLIQCKYYYGRLPLHGQDDLLRMTPSFDHYHPIYAFKMPLSTGEPGRPPMRVVLMHLTTYRDVLTGEYMHGKRMLPESLKAWIVKKTRL